MDISSLLHNIDPSKLSKKELAEAVRLAEELDRRQRLRKIDSYYQETGPLRRELYPKHMDYFSAGKRYMERCALAANRVGKTEGIGAYELTLHLTGEYPEWWDGRRFDRPVKAWCAGDTGKTVRDIIQYKLLGPFGDFGTGMIPGEAIVSTSPKYGLPEAVELVKVKSVFGGSSEITLKSYDQGRKSFQGTEIDVIWLDEEPPLDVYSECVMRLMTTNGILLCTFTPLSGMSDVVMSFQPGTQ